MDQKISALSEIKIVGIETRTNNNSATIDISDLWQKFFSENVKEKISNKISEDVISLYTDYESDHTKPYTVVLGCKVDDNSVIPEGMTGKTIPAAKYEVFSAKGKMPEAIVQTWEHIWSLDLERTYSGDFELYTEKYSSDPPEAEIFIAIK